MWSFCVCWCRNLSTCCAYNFYFWNRDLTAYLIRSISCLASWWDKLKCIQQNRNNGPHNFHLPVNNVYNENLVSLQNENSVHEMPKTGCWTTCPWLCYHLLQKIAILIDEKGSEDSTPEEVEAHAEVENTVQMLSSHNFTNKSIVWENRNQNKYPFE